ncbi:MAG: HNH endonuclease [Alphaproteobacteria bacterium]|nr:HNH endonuclease [Alphaproteobacteria bacterium]
MKLSVDLSRLERARASIGAEKARIGDLAARRKRGRNPIEVQLIEKGSVVLSGEELAKVLRFPSGLAAIGNTQITLHILQPFVSKEDLEHVPALNPKFHVYDCDTLERMRTEQRFNRYVSTAEPSGRFLVEPWDRALRIRGERMEAVLKPCRYCLKALDYDGYSSKSPFERTQLVENFDLRKFFENYEHIFRCLPVFTTENFPDGNYTSDWARISEARRRQANWICSSCTVDLKDNRGLLHVHHVDGNRGNNKPSNLKVLCCVCHQKQPRHGHMYVGKNDRAIIDRLRHR